MNLHPTFYFLTIIIILFPCRGIAQKIQLDDIPIGWEDFQAKTAPRSAHAAAHISIGISYGYTRIPITRNNHTLTFNTKIDLLRDKSWLNRAVYERLSPQAQQKLLNHEKGHFIIGLIYYNELIQTLHKKNYQGNSKRKVRRTFNKVSSKMDRNHKKYDKDTKHGILDAEQDQWGKRLLKELNKKYSLEELQGMEF